MLTCEFCQSEPIPTGYETYFVGMCVCKNCAEIIMASIRGISVARQRGVPKYNASSWRDDDFSTHLDHANDHIVFLLEGGEGLTDEDDLAHAACRIAMALALRADEAGQ